MSKRPDFDVSNSTVAVTKAVVDALVSFQGNETEIAKVTSVKRHRGRFATPEAVKREITGNGAIRVAALNVTNVRKEAGSLVGTVALVAFVLACDLYGYDRDARAEVIASKLAVTVAKQDWPKVLGRTAYKQAQQVATQNLCTDALDKVGVAIWSVSWTQECRLNEPVNLSTLDEFLCLELDSTVADGAPILAAEINVREEQ